MKKVEIYSSMMCGHCHAAKALLKKRGIPFEDIDVTFDPKKRAEMEKRARRYTVPQIFIGNKSIGGRDELYALDAAGKLKTLVGGE